VVVTTPNEPSSSGRVVKLLGLMLVMKFLLLRSSWRFVTGGLFVIGAAVYRVVSARPVARCRCGA
jgi:hypothetical protein